MDLIYIVASSISIIIFLISLVNLLTTPELKKVFTKSSDLVSILIPARNEEKNIENCIKDCLNQTYQEIEILVLNDNSTDLTEKVIKKFSDKVTLLSGEEVSSGWLGKNWACHQLSQKANGNLLLFIDADVRLKPEAVGYAVTTMKMFDVKLLTIFPTQIMKSFSEYLIVPLMNWLLLSFLPLKLVHKSKKKSFIAANGQFMLWDKDFYFSLGGHLSVKNKSVEDMEFARIVKLKKEKMITLLGGNLVFCRMYSNLNEAINGFSKNFYPGFRLNPTLFLSIFLIISISQLIPFFYWKDLTISVSLIILNLMSRIFISIKSRQNIFLNFILHIFQMIIVMIEAVISVYRFHFGKLYWKGRKI
jgi:chlorobactene glucosyltransferase